MMTLVIMGARVERSGISDSNNNNSNNNIIIHTNWMEKNKKLCLKNVEEEELYENKNYEFMICCNAGTTIS